MVFSFLKLKSAIFSLLGESSHGLAAIPLACFQGVYSFNALMDWTSPNIPVIPYGHYRLTAVSGLLGSREIKYCVTTEVHCIPRPK